MPAGSFTTRLADRCGHDQGDTAAGQALDRFPRGRVCRRASWLRPSTRSPGRCRRRFSIRPGSRSVDAPDGTPRRRDARPGPPHGRGEALGRLTTRPVIDRCGPGTRADTAGLSRPRAGLHTLPRPETRCGPGHTAGAPRAGSPHAPRPGCRSVADQESRATGGRHGRGKDSIVLPAVISEVHWPRPATRLVEPRGSLTRPVAVGVDSTRATRPRAGPRQVHHVAGLPTCILVEALDTLPWSMPAGFSMRPVVDRCGPEVDGPLADVDHPRARPGLLRPRPGRRRPPVRLATARLSRAIDTAGSPNGAAAGFPHWSSPRGRVCRSGRSGSRPSKDAPLAGAGVRRSARGHRLADGRRGRSDTRPGDDGRADQDQLDRLTTRPVADVHPGRGPRHAPLVDAGLHAAGLPIGAEGPGRHGRGQDLDRFPRGRLPTCILVEALDTLPWSMPAGFFIRPGCRSVRTRYQDATAVDGPRPAHHAARFATRPSAARPRQAPLVDAGGSPTRPGCRLVRTRPGRTAAYGPRTGPHAGVRRSGPGPRHGPRRCRRGAPHGRVVDRCGPGPGRHGRRSVAFVIS